MALIKLNNRSSEDNAIHGRRNLIINGAMQVAQRGTSETGVTSGGYYTVDRFRLAYNGSPDELEFTHEQSTDAPTGFSNSLKLTVTTAETTLAADERVRLQQRIEGQNLQHLKYGTSDAEYLTLSFYVKSNVTGTYGIHLDNIDSGRNVCATYTINVANTWEKKTISIAGDTTGSFNNDNNRSLDFCWVLAAGTDYTSGTLATSWEGNTDANHAPSAQIDITDTISNSWQITGVQLEVGTTATPFERRSYAEELSLCSRYYHTSFSGETTIGGSHPANYAGKVFSWCDHYGSSPDRVAFNYQWPVQMRDLPTVTMYGNQWTSARMSKYNGGSSEYTIDYASGVSRNGLGGYYDVAGTNGDFVVAYVEASAEL